MRTADHRSFDCRNRARYYLTGRAERFPLNRTPATGGAGYGRVGTMEAWVAYGSSRDTFATPTHFLASESGKEALRSRSRSIAVRVQ